MSSTRVGAFLLGEGFAPPAASAVLREGSVVAEAGRYALRSLGDRRNRSRTPYAGRVPARSADPVVLVPGFLAGDGTLRFMAASLRRQGFRTYRSHIRANIGCTLAAAEELEQRIESIALRRGGRVQVVGHSLGGMIARGLAVRRPDLISGIVTMGSPMLAPGAHHGSLSRSVDLLVRLNKAGLGSLMSEDCITGGCARLSFDESRLPVRPDVAFTAIYSKRDGIVDWRACVDPGARAVEVTTSHVGMAVDPRVIDHVADALRMVRTVSAVEVDRGKSA